jgi:hypothetical protein
MATACAWSSRVALPDCDECGSGNARCSVSLLACKDNELDSVGMATLMLDPRKCS